MSESVVMADDVENVLKQMVQMRDVKLAEAAQYDAAIRALQTKIIIADNVPQVQDFAGLGIIEAAKRWLGEIGESKTTREIADAIKARGLTTKSKDFVPTVYATLKNSHDFIRKGDVWELKKRTQ